MKGTDAICLSFLGQNPAGYVSLELISFMNELKYPVVNTMNMTGSTRRFGNWMY
jgi:hypothetical protein